MIVSFGKLKTAGMRDAADHYLKALGSWYEAQEVELRAVAVPDKSEATRNLVQAKEAEALFTMLSRRKTGRSALYLLDETGKAMPSAGWARLLKDNESRSVQELVFCIGSSLGFREETRTRADGLLSFGPQTLPHELARVVLLEQLFRAASINQGHPYHNEG